MLFHFLPLPQFQQLMKAESNVSAKKKKQNKENMYFRNFLTTMSE